MADRGRPAQASAAWAEALASWRIPETILAAAPEDPWSFPTEVFQRRADIALHAPRTPSGNRAAEALTEPGTVLDVGAGGGAAGLAIADRCTVLTAVDPSAKALEGLRRRADLAGVRVDTRLGNWPELANGIDSHDVVVCHHVVYNVPRIGPFISALASHARRRVVIELTDRHPLSWLNPLWREFHELDRPDRPTWKDLIAVIEELGIAPTAQLWQPIDTEPELSFVERVAMTRRRLCLGGDREPEVAAAMARIEPATSGRVTIWWDASDPGSGETYS